MQSRSSSFAVTAAVLALAVLSLARTAAGQSDDSQDSKYERHGRKYKAPPETSHIEVTVVKDFNGKPIDGAHVILHPVKGDVDEGNMELKTHQDGKAVIDVIPTGSSVGIQVLADGFATFAQDYVVTEPSRAITVRMLRPRAQVSAYQDNDNSVSQRQPGVQEPIRPKPGAASTSGSSSSTGTPSEPAAKPQA